MLIDINEQIRHICVTRASGAWQSFHYTVKTPIEKVRAVVNILGGTAWAGQPFTTYSYGKRRGQVREYQGLCEKCEEVIVIQEDGSLKTMYVCDKHVGTYDKTMYKAYKAVERERQERKQVMRRQREAITESLTELSAEQLTQVAQYINTLTNR